ncbi:MAG: translocation/assembly module TamB domain-containing protein, partial [Candidatus Zixiibacteriota bacterium]
MRRLIRIVLALVLGVVLLAGSLWLYLFPFGGAERIVNSQLDSLVTPRHNVEIRVGNISGDLLSGVVLEDVSIRFTDSTGEYVLALLPRVAAAYSLANLWNREYILEYAVLDSALITLMQDSTGRWRLPDLSATGDAGGSVPTFSVADLKIIGAVITVIRPADTLQFDNITLAGAIRGGDGTYALDLRRLAFTSTTRNVEVTTASGQVTYTDGLLVFKNVEAVSRGARLRLDGSVTFKDILQGQIIFDVNNADMSVLSEYMGISYTGVIDVNGAVLFDRESVRGSASVAGDFEFLVFENLYTSFEFRNRRVRVDTLYGTVFGNCTIDGRGELDLSDEIEHYYLKARIRNFNLEEMLPNSFRSDLTGFLELNGEAFSTDRLRLAIHTELHDSRFDDYALHHARGELLVTADSIVFVDSFRVDYYENVITATGRIDYSEDIDLAIAAEVDNFNRFAGQFFVDRPGGRAQVEAVLSGQSSDPDVRGLLTSDSLWVYDLYSSGASISVQIEKFLTSRRGECEVRLGCGSAWGTPFDSGYMQLAIDSNLVSIESLTVGNEYAQITGSGLLDYLADPMLLFIDSIDVDLFDRTFHNRSPIELTIDSLGFDVRRGELGNGGARLALTGRVNYDESVDVAANVKDVPLRPWLQLFDTTLALRGNVSFDAQVEGMLATPVFSIYGVIDSLMYRDLVLGRLVSGAHYADRLLTLDSLIVLSDAGEYRANGSVHVDLAIAPNVMERFPDLPLDMRLTARDSRFDLVSVIMPSVEQLDGDFFADISLSGTPHDPHLQGEAYITGARLKYFDLEHSFFSDSASVTMTDNRIIIDGINTYVRDKKHGGRKRPAILEGEIVVKTLDSLYWDVDISLPREFPAVYELDDISGVVEGELSVIGDSPPLVTGDLTVISMKYLVNFADYGQVSPVTQALLSGKDSWDLNINIDMLANYWIKNEDIDAEFAGQLNLIREDGVYRFIGEMEVLRGRGFLFDKTFHLEPGGKVTFVGDPKINPILDLK